MLISFQTCLARYIDIAVCFQNPESEYLIGLCCPAGPLIIAELRKDTAQAVRSQVECVFQRRDISSSALSQ